jgi:hypothetical protein
VLKHIYTDEIGFTNFSRYFEYLERIKDQIPEDIHTFFSDVSRYDLNGPNTLHDAWIEEINFSRKYVSSSNEIESGDLKIRLLLAAGGSIAINYADVIGCEFHGFSSKWPDRAVDLLVHEFYLESDGIFSHTLVFDRDIYLKVLFRNFSYALIVNV